MNHPERSPIGPGPGTVQALPTATPNEPLDLVVVEGLVASTVIGICEDELHARQPVRIDLTAGVPRLRACMTDRIEDTLDYAGMRAAILALLDTHRLQLLEALAEHIAQLVLKDFGAHWVRVGVAKPRKFDDVERVGVVIERRRAPVERSARHGDAVLSLMGAGLVPGPRR